MQEVIIFNRLLVAIRRFFIKDEVFDRFYGLIILALLTLNYGENSLLLVILDNILIMLIVSFQLFSGLKKDFKQLDD